ncbi:CGNR zinc finger domain-containing protein [Streptomyces sp. NPDC008163]|uniref:CGNR zinc finger domain-containing protein n=1 Tax=Streptomyces sp. NPDC008163 TaxID=3364818 RepID=UPI0036E8E607
MAATFTELPVEELTEFINAWGTLPREAAGRSAPSQHVGIAAHLGLPADVDAKLTAGALTRTADRLHAVFAAESSEKGAQQLTDMLADTGARPVLEVAAHGSLNAAWRVNDLDQLLLASSALALRAYVAAHGFNRIGICTGDRCVDVYIDRSPGGRRRFCSVTCQNRTRVAAFRRRRAAPDG